jgi:hypothetical protein
MFGKWLIAAAALALGLTAAPGPAVPQQQATGCLAIGDCGTKGTTPGPRRDYWYNWLCSGCHTGPTPPLAPSPQEYALIQVPVRFWTMHAEAERNGETRMRARQYRLLPPQRLAPQFKVLMAQRPAQP